MDQNLSHEQDIAMTVAEIYQRGLHRSAVRADGRRYIVLHGMFVDQFGVRHYTKRDIKFAVWVWDLYHPDDPCKKGFHVHHGDHNRLNDSPPNLIKWTIQMHARHHMQGNTINKGRHLSEEHKDKIRTANQGKTLSAKHKAAIAKTITKLRAKRGDKWYEAKKHENP